MQALKHLLGQILSFLLLALMALVITGWLLLDRTPLVAHSTKLNAASVQHGQQLMSSIHASMQNEAASQLVIQTNADELNAAFAIAARTLPGFQGETQLKTDGLAVLMTMPWQVIGQRFYVNATIHIDAVQGPLQLQQVQVGKVTLPGRFALSLLSWVADQAWGPGEGAKLLAKVRSVTVHDNAVTVELDKPQGFGLASLKQQGVNMYRKLTGADSMKQDVEHYYQLAQQFSKTQPEGSLVAYLQLVFREAAKRTAGSADAERAIVENRAAIYGLAQLFGGKNLQLLVNEVKHDDEQASLKVTLGRRRDLQQHFLYSATIHLLTSQNMSNTVGETKELLDSLTGGSGFSFVDLLADKAGVRFARLATDNVAQAKALQAFFVQQERHEQEVFPSKARLAEGMPQQLFEQQYQSIDSAVYQQMVAEIDRRLDALPLYQLANQVPPAP